MTFIALFAAVAIFSLAGCCRESNMVFPGADWEERSPESQGVDATQLQAALEYLRVNSGENGIDEVVVIRNGYLIWKGGDIDRRHCIWSATKSFTSTALGHLIDNGVCTLDTRAAEYVSSLRTHYAGVTLRHFATMTSGYNAEGATYGKQDPDDGSLTPLIPSKPVSAPGAMFSYFDDAMRMNGYVLTKIASEDLDSYFRRHIARPIGMPDSSWMWTAKPENVGRNFDWSNPDSLDVRDAAGGMVMTARSLARLGHLYLNHGMWNGTRILSEAWVADATRPQVPAGMEGRRDTQRQRGLTMDGIGRYGYNWWINGAGSDGRRWWPDVPAGAFTATGYNHNMCAVVPEWRLVVVRTGTDGSPRRRTQVWNNFLRMIGEALAGV